MSGWISVEDRFPELTGRYLVSAFKYATPAARKQWGASKFTSIASFNAGSSYFLGHSGPNNPVAHWMPLPEPPT